jgi:CheY-like chemotaxis protein
MTSTLEGTSVLVVDDEPDNVELLKIVLVDAGATVRTAGGSRDALEVLAEWTPDVMLLDVSMPGMDGLDLLATIRSTERLREIPSVAVTGDASAVSKEHAFAVGFRAYVTKPFSVDALVGLVEWLAEPGRRHAKGPTPAWSSVSLP